MPAHVESGVGAHDRMPGVAYQVGDVTFGLRGEKDMVLALDPALRDFEVIPTRRDVAIHVKWSDSLERPCSQPAFRSGGLWSSYDRDGGHYFCFNSPVLGRAPYKTAWFNRELTSVCVELSRSLFSKVGTVHPMEYPLDELLMIYRLACGEGIEVHAVGVVDESGRGHLFVGHSGAGKSTTARLWAALPSARILSDDRVILRLDCGRVRMYGTPWHGDAGLASPESALLSRMYLLEHSQKNELIPVSKGRAAADLLARSFVPHHSAAALEFTLNFVEQVARQIPCALFRFVPDQSAVEAICRASA